MTVSLNIEKLLSGFMVKQEISLTMSETKKTCGPMK